MQVNGKDNGNEDINDIIEGGNNNNKFDDK